MTALKAFFFLSFLSFLSVLSVLSDLYVFVFFGNGVSSSESEISTSDSTGRFFLPVDLDATSDTEGASAHPLDKESLRPDLPSDLLSDFEVGLVGGLGAPLSLPFTSRLSRALSSASLLASSTNVLIESKSVGK